MRHAPLHLAPQLLSYELSVSLDVVAMGEREEIRCLFLALCGLQCVNQPALVGDLDDVGLKFLFLLRLPLLVEILRDDDLVVNLLVLTHLILNTPTLPLQLRSLIVSHNS